MEIIRYKGTNVKKLPLENKGSFPKFNLTKTNDIFYLMTTFLPLCIKMPLAGLLTFIP